MVIVLPREINCFILKSLQIPRLQIYEGISKTDLSLKAAYLVKGLVWAIPVPPPDKMIWKSIFNQINILALNQAVSQTLDI